MIPLVLIIVVLLADGGAAVDWRAGPAASLGPLAILLLGWAGPILALTAIAMVVRRAVRRIERGAGFAAIAVAERVVRIVETLLAVGFAAHLLLLGALSAARDLLGDLVLVDELVVVAPMLVASFASIWLWHPLARRLRGWSVLARLDDSGEFLGERTETRAIPAWSGAPRLRWTVAQFRVRMLLMFVPITIALGAVDAAHRMSLSIRGGPDMLPALIATATLVVAILMSSLIIRSVLDTASLAEGNPREELALICRRHRVRMRDFLLWRTDHSILNAAVVGVVGPLRFILVSDALLAALGPVQRRAVFAHEVAHVRHRHLLIGLVTLAAGSAAAVLLARVAIAALPQGAIEWIAAEPGVPALTTLVPSLLALLVSLLLFGWVSRRCERQADTFAVVEISRHGPSECKDKTGSAGARAAFDDRISPEAVEAMCGALDAVRSPADRDGRRRNWRHGSMRWRQEYLRLLAGQPIESLPIDRAIRRITIAAVGILAISVGVELWLINH